MAFDIASIRGKVFLAYPVRNVYVVLLVVSDEKGSRPSDVNLLTT